MLKEFKDFVLRGNVFDMAVGIVIGGAFGPIVSTFVAEILMPPLGLLAGGVDFSGFFWILRAGTPPPPYATLAAAKTAGAVVLGFGAFANTVVSFLIMAAAIFMLVKVVARLRKAEAAAPAAPTTRDCPECLMAIPLAAKRCGHCASAVAPASR